MLKLLHKYKFKYLNNNILYFNETESKKKFKNDQNNPIHLDKIKCLENQKYNNVVGIDDIYSFTFNIIKCYIIINAINIKSNKGYNICQVLDILSNKLYNINVLINNNDPGIRVMINI